MMAQPEHDLAHAVLHLLADELADRLAPKVAALMTDSSPDATPWLTTAEAIEYSRLPEGTFRKLAACGKIPSHGGRAKLFYRPELDRALLDLVGIGEEIRQLRRVR
jgi:hypothetical protein